MRQRSGFWTFLVGCVLAAQGSWAASRWSASLTLGPERFQIASSQGGAAVDQVPWAGRITLQYAWRKNLAVKLGSGFLTGSRLEKVSPVRGLEEEVRTTLWGYPGEVGLVFPMRLSEGVALLPGLGLGYCRLHYEERQSLGGTAASSTQYRLSGFQGMLTAALEAKAAERLFLVGEVRTGLPWLRETWSEGSDTLRTTFARDVRPTWSGMNLGFRWKL